MQTAESMEAYFQEFIVMLIWNMSTPLGLNLVVEGSANTQD
jgi:hypothetical protein